MKKQPDHVLTIAEVAALLKVSRRTLDTLRRREDFPREVRMGGDRGFPKYLADELIAWVSSPDRKKEPGDFETILYRHYDAAGALLYVGISIDVLKRVVQHKTYSAWFDRVVRIDLERFPNRDDALRAERAAIRTEGPAHNIAYAIDQ